MSTDNRELMLGAAERLFAEKGYQATSTREIVDAIQVTQPMLYYYFQSKEGLFVELVSSRFAEFGGELERQLEDARSPSDVFCAYAAFMVSMVMQRPATVRLLSGVMFGAKDGLPIDSLWEPIVAYVAILRTHIARVTPDVDPARRRFVTQMFNGMITSVQFRLLAGIESDVPPATAGAIGHRAARMLTDDLPCPDWPPDEEAEAARLRARANAAP